MLLYLDTNVPSYAVIPAEIPPAVVRASRALLRQVRRGLYEAVVGPVTVAEIQAISNGKQRRRVFRTLRRHGVRTLSDLMSSSAEALCDAYLSHGVVGERRKADALHAAWATISGAEILVTWNRRSVAKWKARELIGIVNARWGYAPLLVLKPTEILGETDQV